MAAISALHLVHVSSYFSVVTHVIVRNMPQIQSAMALLAFLQPAAWVDAVAVETTAAEVQIPASLLTTESVMSPRFVYPELTHMTAARACARVTRHLMEVVAQTALVKGPAMVPDLVTPIQLFVQMVYPVNICREENTVVLHA